MSFSTVWPAASLADLALSDAYDKFLLARRQHHFGLAIIGAVALTREIDKHGCAVVDIRAFAGARPDDQRAGVQVEDRCIDLSCLDLQRLVRARFAKPRPHNIVARLQRTRVEAVFGGDIVAGTAVRLAAQ